MTRLFIINTISFTVLSFIHTALPIIGRNILKISNARVGFLIALSVVSSMFIRLAVGRFIDTKGTRLPVVIGVILSVTGVLLFAVRIDWYVYMLASVILGIGSYLIIISTIISLSKSTKKEKYVSAFGKFGISFYLPVFYAPALVLLMYKINIRWIMVLAALLYFAVIFVFPYSNRPDDAVTKKIDKKYFKISLPMLLIFPLTMFDGAIWTFFIVYLMNSFSEQQVLALGSKFFVILSVVVIITKILISRRKRELFSRRMYYYIVLGMILVVVSGLLIVTGRSRLLLFVPLFYGMGFALCDVFLITLTINSYPILYEGIAVSAYSIFFDLGWIIGSFGLGVVADKYGYISMYGVATTFVTIAFLIAFIKYLILEKD